jgi:hypothetical protein
VASWARRVSGQGVIQVAGQRLRVGYANGTPWSTSTCTTPSSQVSDHAGELLAAILRTSSHEVTRTKGYGVRDRVSQPT